MANECPTVCNPLLKPYVLSTIINYCAYLYFSYGESTLTIPGDMLLVTAFVSYAGCFTKRYRLDLLERNWIPHLRKVEVKVPPWAIEQLELPKKI